jgi:UDP-N-acetylglucosamine 2-epimerase (non-hydrolysing)
MKKILVVFGTRPEAIKMAPLVKELYKYTEFNTKVCVTAQHREMLDQVLEFFLIQPNYDLDLMKANQTLNQLSARILTAIDEVLVDFNPDLVLVHGDTSTSSMVALAAFHRGIKIGHVEAGLRTYNKLAPFPEEINRQITGRLADIHFAPTEQSAQNLLNEGVLPNAVHITGNTVIDALLWGIKNVNKERADIKEINTFLDRNKKLIVVTGHRRESFGNKFYEFCNALKELANREDVQIIYPVHLNPNVQKAVYDTLGNHSNILLIAPLDYEVFIWLLNQSFLIITDSGGVQEEAPSLKKPVLVTREVTERQEAVEQGTVKLVGTNKVEILKQAFSLLDNDQVYQNMVGNKNPYGDGTTSKQIVKILKSI